MFPTKTDKARDELQSGQRTLSQRERALLLMADGRRSLTDFSPLFANRSEAEQALQALMSRGYLHYPQATPAPTPVPTAQAAAMDRAAEPAQAATAADHFDGKRSLATTRMFLFDICERMFVRRDPVLAEQFREMLRESRDRDGMLAVAGAMLDEIAKSTGAERAASIRERIDKLLPAPLVH